MSGIAGKSILEILWDELDSIVDRIMDDGEPDVDEYEESGESQRGSYTPLQYDIGALGTAFKEWGEQRGQAQGVAYAIALLTDPTAPDVPGVRAQAMQRWEDRQDDEPSDATKTRAMLRPQRRRPRHQRK